MMPSCVTEARLLYHPRESKSHWFLPMLFLSSIITLDNNTSYVSSVT